MDDDDKPVADQASDAVADALGRALPGMVTGFLCVVSWVDQDGDQRITTVNAEGQVLTTQAGLLAVAQAQLDLELAEWVEGLDRG